MSYRLGVSYAGFRQGPGGVDNKTRWVAGMAVVSRGDRIPLCERVRGSRPRVLHRGGYKHHSTVSAASEEKKLLIPRERQDYPEVGRLAGARIGYDGAGDKTVGRRAPAAGNEERPVRHWRKVRVQILIGPIFIPGRSSRLCRCCRAGRRGPNARRSGEHGHRPSVTQTAKSMVHIFGAVTFRGKI